jgi:glycogen debranching enzyme
MADLVNLSETTVLKDGNAFVVSLRDGSLPASIEHPLGLYMDDCRHLGVHELRAGGRPGRLLVASDELGSVGVHELTNPELELPDGRKLPLQALQLRIERAVDGGAGALEELLVIHAYVREQLDVDLELILGTDFAPMLAVRGLAGGPPPPVEPEARPDGVRFARVGADGIERSTIVSADPAPDRADGGALCWRLSLPPGGQAEIRLRYDLENGVETPSHQPVRPIGFSDWLADRTRVVADDELFNRVVRRSVLDVRMLRSQLDGWEYCAAGIPWYATLFGRDSLITATELLAFDPGMAEGTLRLLASRLGADDVPDRDEEPGKVIHELRVGELANTGATPLARYYGTVDATALFLCLIADHAAWTGELRVLHDLRDAVDAALGWLDHWSDRDGDGLIDYRARAKGGLRNQGWKDSWDGVVDEHGVPMEPPIALVEVQGYAIRARRSMADLLERDGDGATATRLRTQADQHARRLEDFWVEELGRYGMARDGSGHTSRALASNQGHLLWARAIPPERAVRVAEAMVSDELFSGWGIRTLGAAEPAFNPVGYHTGSVWPHDNALIADGLRHYGYDEEFTRVFESLLEAASHTEDYRLPELFAGFSRAEFERPVPYPVACRPQAWAAGAIPYLMTAGLGLIPDGLEGRLRIRRPSLPRWLGQIEVRGLRVGHGRVDLRFERTAPGGPVALSDARIDGDVEVVLEIGP